MDKYMARIKVINHNIASPLNFSNVDNDMTRKVRVAAYCRVSTLAEEQELSFESQRNYYKALFERNDRYYLVGVYGDQGITGLKADKRPQFQEMLRECRKGRIDEIYTKSISRFARNFSECLEVARELQSLGVIIHFEKEQFTTADDTIEMIFSLMAIVAQEEVNSLSQSISWSNQQRNRAGDPIRAARYGYRRDREPIEGIHNWHINEEEAIRVRLAYDLFEKGKTQASIANELNAFEAEHGEKRKWTHQAVRNLLLSEVYVGDILTNKTYTVDYLTKKKKRNEGEMEQHYLKNHHPGIISREQDAVVKETMERRKHHDKTKLGS